MPYIRMGDDFEDLDQELDDRDPDNMHAAPSNSAFTYDPAKGRFNANKLGELERVTLEQLRAIGATHLRATYDGGFDEGFAQFESATINGVKVPAVDLPNLLVNTPLVARLKATAPDQGPQDLAWVCRQIGFALEELADAIASSLLGRGFGTGEYELYGAFDADLATGQITDDQHATKPPARE